MGKRVSLVLLLVLLSGPVFAQWPMEPAPPGSAGAGESLCDDSYQDCRSAILQLINTETVGIDVSYWFMTDWRYAGALINAHQRGVPVRVLVDVKADSYRGNQYVRDLMAANGIAIRAYAKKNNINHWKMFLFAGHGKVVMSAGNFATGSYSPTTPYHGYVDEAVFFSDRVVLVNSFMRKFDDQWVSRKFRNYANVTTPARNYPVYPIHSSLNFEPDHSFEARAAAVISHETTQIDAAIFRITSPVIPDALIAAHRRGVIVHLITEPRQYSSKKYPGDYVQVNRMLAAGIDIKMKHNTTDQDMHQKSFVAHSMRVAVFGSSNWDGSRSEQHNIFSYRPWVVEWFLEQFDRKWNNHTADGAPIVPEMYVPFGG